MNIYSMSVEIMLAALLLIAIAYCWRLDGKLKQLRTGSNRMLEAAKELQSSVVHAENAIGALRRSADAAGRDLQTRIDEARALNERAPAARDSGHGNVQDFQLRRRSIL